MPLHTIMTAANTVSRASPDFSSGAATMTETISATSMTVTATARTRVPNGSPVRWATTSALYTAANTVTIRTAPAAAATRPPAPTKNVATRIAQANKGHAHAHQGVRAAAMPLVTLCSSGKVTRPVRVGRGEQLPHVVAPPRRCIVDGYAHPARQFVYAP